MHHNQGRRCHRIIGGHKRRLGIWGMEFCQRGLGASPERESGGQSPLEAEVFFVKLHLIFALKYNKYIVHFPWGSGHSFLCAHLSRHPKQRHF